MQDLYKRCNLQSTRVEIKIELQFSSLQLQAWAMRLQIQSPTALMRMSASTLSLEQWTFPNVRGRSIITNHDFVIVRSACFCTA